MKNIIKDRKTLSLVLCLVLVSVFTLTVAYSALSAVLTINGNARVSAANWDIYLNNPRVTSGSATTNLPEIKTSSTLEFETTLNMPGDFYEFTVDVVNEGDIDAMIENIVKTPDLTADQAKFLKYEITYQNNEPITTKQLLAKDATMPIKVRIEYRKDLSNTDLPTNQIVLDLALTLEYIQSDGTGNSVNNNGVQVVSANGDINEIGTIVTIGTEQFYTIGTDGDDVLLLSKYNITLDEIPIQNESIWNNNMLFSTETYWNSIDEYPAYVYSSESALYEYVESYKRSLVNKGISIKEARLISVEELIHLNCSMDINEYGYYNGNCDNAPEWVSSTLYWTGSSISDDCVLEVEPNYFGCSGPQNIDDGIAIRPVIVISKDYF